MPQESAYAAEPKRWDVQAERAAWRATQPALDATNLVFLDETSLSANVARRVGRCAKGERLKAAILMDIGRPPRSWSAFAMIA